MSRILIGALSAMIFCSMVATAGFAGQPDPGQCFGDLRCGVSPKNLCVAPAAQYVYEYFLLDNTGAPVAGFPASQVEMRFTACSNQSTRPQNEIPFDADSDVNGRVEFRVNANWGGGDPCAVEVLVQNTVFTTLEAYDPGPPEGCGGLRSPDENGDGLVALADLSIWQQAFVTGGPPYRGDLAENFDCLAALADLSVWQQHFVCQ